MLMLKSKKLFTLLFSFVLLFNVTANADSAKTPFADVEKGSWYEGAVAYAYENGLISGTSESEFSPDIALSRAQLVTIIWRMAGEPAADKKTTLDNVAEGSWYENAVYWAVILSSKTSK